ncbi:FhaA domain-containing protein [Micromonospora sp. KC723]|uniref:FhaA domain-containing protein n=1 Tax=Micromonospora sp. KC723 TaxID=2530381 RepID=UPI001045AA14|nr:FhaA domain-containing protein [Micromonospora sp. KC723]TDB77970.1 DUF2662 domain-containing protein [Micromonospora sp. KC723]
MLVEALVGWLVQALGDRLTHGLTSLAGGDFQRALRPTVRAAIHTVVEQVPPASRQALSAALAECLVGGPDDGPGEGPIGGQLRAALVARLVPLTDAGITGTGRSFVAEIGVDGAWLLRALPDAVLAAVQRAAAAQSLAGLAAALHTEAILQDIAALRALRTPPPRAEAVPAVVNTLPRRLRLFTGRERELAEITSVGDEGGVFLICGMAGVGKTALAVEAAYRLADRFPDAQLAIDLAGFTPGSEPIDPAVALAALLPALAEPDTPVGTTLIERTAQWRTRLATRRCVLVLDNVADANQVHPLLPGAGESVVLITSRRRTLDIGEARQVELGTLPASAAADLFAGLAGGEPGRLDRDAVAGVVERCARLPLALRLAAARLRGRPACTAADLLDELITATAHPGGDASVEAALAVSYAALAPPERELFRHLALWPGPDVTAAAAAALADVSPRLARQRLTELYDRSLLEEPVAGRYAMHDLLREYAGRLAAGDPPMDRVRRLQRMLDHYLIGANRATAVMFPMLRVPRLTPARACRPPEFADVATAVRWVDEEQLNLQACWRHAMRHGRWAYLRQLRRHSVHALRSRAVLPSLLDLFAEDADAAHRRGAPADEGDAALELGIVHRHMGAEQAADRQLRRALDCFHAARDDQQARNTLLELGSTARVRGDALRARAYLTQCLLRCRRAGDRTGEGHALVELSWLDVGERSFDRARRRLRQALEIHRAEPNVISEANCLVALGETERRSGAPEAALPHLRRAADLSEAVGQRHNAANARANAGLALIDLDRDDEAAGELQEAGVTFAAEGAYPEAARALGEAAHCLARLGRYRAAYRSLDRARRMPRPADSPPTTADPDSMLAVVVRCADRLAEALGTATGPAEDDTAPANPPVNLFTALLDHMCTRVTTLPSGRSVAPNAYTIEYCPADLVAIGHRLGPVHQILAECLADAVATARFVVTGDVTVEAAPVDGVQSGLVKIRSHVAVAREVVR